MNIPTTVEWILYLEEDVDISNYLKDMLIEYAYDWNKQ